MIFITLNLSEDGIVTGKAKGHPSEVISAFHSVASLLLSSRDPWRITDVTGSCPEDGRLDSDMDWVLTAKLKK